MGSKQEGKHGTPFSQKSALKDSLLCNQWLNLAKIQTSRSSLPASMNDCIKRTKSKKIRGLSTSLSKVLDKHIGLKAYAFHKVQHRAGRDDVTTGKLFPSRGECLSLYRCVLLIFKGK